jgi:hypothetical protein
MSPRRAAKKRAVSETHRKRRATIKSAYRKTRRAVSRKTATVAGKYLARRRYKGKKGGKLAHYAGRYLAKRRYAKKRRRR